jgi:hypothetical protein
MLLPDFGLISQTQMKIRRIFTRQCWLVPSWHFSSSCDHETQNSGVVFPPQPQVKALWIITA